VSLTGGIIVFSAYRDTANPVEKRLVASLLWLLAAFFCTWAGLFFHYYIPAAYPLFFPIYSACGLLSPILLYHLICNLTDGFKLRFFALHYILPALWGTAVIVLHLLGASVDFLYEYLFLARAIVSLIYFSFTFHRLYLNYIDTQSTNNNAVFVPSKWITGLLILSFISLINAILYIVVWNRQSQSWLGGMAAVLVSAQMLVLVYNIIMRNFILFVERKTFPLQIPQYYSDAARRKEMLHRGEAALKVSTAPDSTGNDGLTKTKFQNHIKKYKPFLDSHLTLPELARQLNTSRNTLSAFINQTYRKNFNQYMNMCRLKELQRLKELPANTDTDLQVLVAKVGFGSYRNYQRMINNPIDNE
jgi:AraC-like DNA-binding protein